MDKYTDSITCIYTLVLIRIKQAFLFGITAKNRWVS